MQVKICGITKPEELEYLNGADYAGFVFFEKSKRNISYEQASEILKNKGELKTVAVTVSPDADMLKDLEKLKFDVIQVHKELKKDFLEKSSIPIWYAFNISNPEELAKKKKFFRELPQELSDKIQGIVVDGAEYGSGKTFKWDITLKDKLREICENRLFILAGGLNPSNVQEGMNIFSPDMVDVSSGVEGTNGKDRNLVKDFIERVREYE